ncbi:melatonin receptor type 1B-B-like [Orbicella faveolata]|uniref:melatonin receptor type 1B-B-like n=1 Tax=Orbicella faveolata TaxID=48498 RepID=UPI0009E33CD4|nr:melatonin receptor type 1B-B-like [Orbicella faveolata]
MEKTAGGFDLPYRSPGTAALESIIVVLFTILSILENTLIIAAFFHLKSLRTIPNILVVNLSIVDVLSAITTHPLLASVLIQGAWCLGQEACKYQAILNSFLFTTKTLSVTFITLNRYLIIVRYKKYTNMFTKRSTRLFLVAIWISSCLLALSPIMEQDEATFHAKESLCVISSKNSASSVVMVVFENIFFLATIYLNYAILSLVRLHRKQVFSFFDKKTSPSTSRVTPASAALTSCRPYAIGTRGTIANRNEEPHIARKVFTVTTLYTICWLPQGILKIASLTNNNMSREIWMTSTFCMQLSSVLNPILYGLLNRKLRKTIFGMFKIKAKMLIHVAATEVSTRRLQMRSFKGAFTVSRVGAQAP